MSRKAGGKGKKTEGSVENGDEGEWRNVCGLEREHSSPVGRMKEASG